MTATPPPQLGGIAPLSRDVLAETIDLLDAVEKVVAEVPYKRAQPAMEQIDAIRETLLATLPGGFCDFCAGCGMPLGEDDVAVSDEDLHRYGKCCEIAS